MDAVVFTAVRIFDVSGAPCFAGEARIPMVMKDGKFHRRSAR
jgi:hypothetical protein